MSSTIIGPGDPDKISRAIASSGLSRREIAVKCGVSDASVSHWALKFRKPAAGNLGRLALALDVPVRELLADG